MEPLQPESLFQGVTLETYAIDGDTPEQLEASLAARGPGSIGSEAKTSYQLVLSKGKPSDQRCGFSTCRVEPSITVTMPRWNVMPNVSDAAKQWWSWRIRKLADQQKEHIKAAMREAKEATVELTKADCRSGDDAFADLNTRLHQAHPAAVFPDAGSDINFQFPGAIVEAPIEARTVLAKTSDTSRKMAPPELYGLELRSLQGQPVALASQRGHVVFLNFWATWCGPCRAEIPSLKRLVDQMKGHDVFFAFVTDEFSDKVQAYVSKAHPDIPIYLGDSAGFKAKVLGYPTTYILAKNGEIALSRLGGTQWDTPEMVELLSSLERQ